MVADGNYACILYVRYVMLTYYAVYLKLIYVNYTSIKKKKMESLKTQMPRRTWKTSLNISFSPLLYYNAALSPNVPDAEMS